MRIENRNLEASWEIIYEDTLLDVAAAIAATEPSKATQHENQPAEGPAMPAAPHSALALRWAVRVPVGIN